MNVLKHSGGHISGMSNHQAHQQNLNQPNNHYRGIGGTNGSVGYTNGMIGYIAPKNEYKYGGYEIDGFIKRFNLKSRINDKIEEEHGT